MSALAQNNADSFNFSADTIYVSDSLFTDSVHQSTSLRKGSSYGLMDTLTNDTILNRIFK